MTVGNQDSVANVNAALSSLAVQLRTLMQGISDQFEFLDGLGTAGLEALGFDSADAAAVLADISYMSTLAEVYYGTAVQTTEYDFDTQLSALWAGQ